MGFELKNDGKKMHPITMETIDALRGVLKIKPEETLITQLLLDDRAEDRSRDES